MDNTIEKDYVVISEESENVNLNNHKKKVHVENLISSTSRLIATTVHDFKNPLANIRGLGELGKMTSGDEKSRLYFERIINQADELNEMIVKLLTIFKPEEKKIKNLDLLIQEIIKSFETVCNSKNIEIVFKKSGNYYVNISENLFKRAFGNLITNAVQAITNDGIIEINTNSYKNHILISIKDNAGGIPESIRENLFDAYTFRREGGSGLGLFMVYYTITYNHNGEIWYETQTGKGTTFYIKLPAIK